MQSFTSFIPGYQVSTDRQNNDRRQPAPPRVNHFEVARRSQRNEMFFTDEDDADSLFGADDTPSVESVEPRIQQVDRRRQPQTEAERHRFSDQTRQDTQRIVSAPDSQALTRTTNNRAYHFAQRPASMYITKPAPVNANLPVIQIKDEEEMDSIMESESLRNIPPSQRVKIFVGKKSQSILVNRADLSKSPILLSYVVDDPIQGSFIMRPQLVKTHYWDFSAVAQFLRSGEYTPRLQDDAANPTDGKVLNGLKGDGDYAKELVRSGKLYGMAKRFGVEGMAELVFRKVSEVDAGKYNVNSLVCVAEIVFKNANGGREEGQDNPIANKQDADPLEVWIIEKLAHNFQEIMRTRPEKFFEVVKATRKKMLYARVLEEIAGKYRASGGTLPVPVIELD